jgi:hypothetical protein
MTHSCRTTPCPHCEARISEAEARRDDPGDPMLPADWDALEAGALWNWPVEL